MRRLAVITGSGLGRLADQFVSAETIAFDRIEGLTAADVPGHRGEIRVCSLDGGELFLVLGRRHVYEEGARQVRVLVDYLVDRGATALVSVSAAGALNTTLYPGDFVIGSSMMDLQNQLAGARPTCDPGLTRMVERAGRVVGITLHRGVMGCVGGPAYESRAEVAFLQRIGADLAMMSGAQEMRAARTREIPAAALAVVTNSATGITRSAPRHTEVLDAAGLAVGRLGRLIRQLVIT